MISLQWIERTWFAAYKKHRPQWLDQVIQYRINLYWRLSATNNIFSCHLFYVTKDKTKCYFTVDLQIVANVSWLLAQLHTVCTAVLQEWKGSYCEILWDFKPKVLYYLDFACKPGSLMSNVCCFNYHVQTFQFQFVSIAIPNTPRFWLLIGFPKWAYAVKSVGFSKREMKLFRTRMHSSRMYTARFSGRLRWGGVCLWGTSALGCTPPAYCMLGYTPLWTEWLTDRCKNITFPQLRLWEVIMSALFRNPYIYMLPFQAFSF